jgi:HlyD family secretion protein
MSILATMPAPPGGPDRRRLLWLFGRQSVLPEAIPFQDPIDEICERPPPRFLRGTLYLVAAFFLSLLLIAAFTKVDIVVVASGRIITATPPIVLQPIERAIIREFRVHPGDAVTKGQILATLDPTFSEADTAALEKQSHTLQAEVRRLQAEVEARPFATGATPEPEEELQGTLYRQRLAEYLTRLRVFDEDIQHLRAGLQTLNDERASLAREAAVARQVEDMRATLLQSQNGSRLTLLEAQSTRIRAEGDLQEAENRLSELRHSEQSREAERQAFVDSWARELTEALVKARTELANVTSSLTKAARLHDLVVVTAPADGIVLDIAQRTEGSVLREAEPLLTIVPKDAPLIAEVMIASSDVGYTKQGADTKLKIDAFPYQQYGLVDGRLETIGEESSAAGGNGDSASAARGGAVHRARVALLDGHLIHGPTGTHLIPGMTLTAEIKSGTRSVLAYFLNPLTRGLSESFREP